MEDFYICPVIGASHASNAITPFPRWHSLGGVKFKSQLCFADVPKLFAILAANGFTIKLIDRCILLTVPSSRVKIPILRTTKKQKYYDLISFISLYRSPVPSPVPLESQLNLFAGFLLSYRVYGRAPWPRCPADHAIEKLGLLAVDCIIQHLKEISEYTHIIPEIVEIIHAYVYDISDIEGIADFVCDAAKTRTCITCQLEKL